MHNIFVSMRDDAITMCVTSSTLFAFIGFYNLCHACQFTHLVLCWASWADFRIHFEFRPQTQSSCFLLWTLFFLLIFCLTFDRLHVHFSLFEFLILSVYLISCLKSIMMSSTFAFFFVISFSSTVAWFKRRNVTNAQIGFLFLILILHSLTTSTSSLTRIFSQQWFDVGFNELCQFLIVCQVHRYQQVNHLIPHIRLLKNENDQFTVTRIRFFFVVHKYWRKCMFTFCFDITRHLLFI